MSDNATEHARRALAVARSSDALSDEAQELLNICSLSAETKRSSGILNARELRDIAERRQRVQEDPKREAPRFRGFRELRSALLTVEDDSSVRVTIILFDAGALRIYTDIEIEVMYGLVYAAIPNYSYWRRYLKDRENIAYSIGYQDGLRHLPPRKQGDDDAMNGD